MVNLRRMLEGRREWVRWIGAAGLASALLLSSGCTTKKAARRDAETAYLRGALSGQANARANAANTVMVLGQVENHTIEWREDLTLAEAILEASYVRTMSPRAIVIRRQGQFFPVSPKRLAAGLDNPLIEPGDIIDLQN